MARRRTCFIVLTMMAVMSSGSLFGWVQAVRHGFPPDILHVDYDEDDPSIRRPIVINRAPENDEEHASARYKRSPANSASRSGSPAASGSAAASLSMATNSVKDSKNSLSQVMDTKVNELNDSHAQLIVHWLGEGTSVMICLAREPPADNDNNNNNNAAKTPPPQPSRIFVSKDYGDTFDDQTEMFALNINGTTVNSTVEQFFTHPKFNTIVFTDPRNKVIFTSEDYGKSVTVRMLNFTPSDVTFYEADTKMILILDKKDPERKLYYTTDFGASFTLLQSYVKSYIWSSGEGVPIHLYVERKEPTNTSSVIFYNAANLRNNSNSFNVLIEKVEDFHIKKDFMFASQRLPNSTQLLISYKRGKFVKADFQTELDMKGYHVADVDGRRIMISVVHTERISHLYVSESNNEMTDIKFVPSLENVFTYVPELNWRSSWLVQSSDGAFTDLYKVEGLRGIYIASKINRIPLGETISPDSLVSLITFDHGASWRPITAPTTDDDGQPIQNCQKDCSLHLSQKFSSLYPVTRSVSIMSSKSAPGVIMASGVVGKSLKGHPGVYISRDAGLTWKQILKDYHFFNMGDHGGILVAVKYFKSKGETNEILYSTDEGEKWRTTGFHSNYLKVYGLMTEPDTNTTIFTLFGSEQEEHKWLIIKVDLKKAFTSNCTEDDYKFWAPGSSHGDTFMPCVLGRQDTYQRRKPFANCYNGIDYERPIRQQVCSCTSYDFECDYGFSRSGSKSNPCVRNKTLANFEPYAVPSDCKPGNFFNRTKGYRKIEGDVCINGYSSQYLPQTIPCPMGEVNEFLVIAQRDKISRINLGNKTKEVFPVTGLKNVIAIEFDMKHNCVFWADIMTDVIGRQCLNGNQSTELLVDSGLSSVEGMSYDWISEMLYFVDGMRLKIEAVKTSIVPLGRMRRTIIDAPNLNKPRGIVVHPLQGYLFWTDWNALRPSVSRANLDGSDIKMLFTKPDVVWPNGVTIDYIAERLYWVDASKDYIASSDLNGKNFIKILQQDSRVAHPFAVAVMKDLMYWDDWKMNSVYSADKDLGIMIDIIAEEMMNSMDLKIYGHSIQEGTNACSEGNKCSHICVGAPKGGHSCLCPDGMEKTAQGQCLCPGGVTPFANNTCARSGSTCGAKFFACKNAICVPQIYKCDGDDDCGDRSDEEGCPADKPPCPPYMFTCKSDKQCVPKYFVCDYDRDCLDGSDEQTCKPASCKSDEYTCGNGRCINRSWLCDGEDDCRDGTDEVTCRRNATAPVECKPDEFRCNGTNTCIPKQWRCDTEHDCNDGSDEANCTRKECELWMFTCEGDNRCIYKTWQCDGEKDCKDGSDEKNCSASTEVPKKPGINFLPGDSCHDWMFKCANDKCVPYWWKCDGVNDCGDGSDEAGCNLTVAITSTTMKPIPPARKKERNCGLHEFRCDSGVCISKRFVCDGYQDCSKGEDEDNCPSQKQCSNKHFKCRSDGMCLPMDKYCNNVIDCADGSDEDCKFKPSTSPNTKNNCTNNPGVFACDNTCFALMMLCDGKPDCYDGTDEENCEKVKTKHYQVTQISVDERSLNSTSFVVFWWIPLPRNVSLEYLPSIYYNGEWKNVSSWIDQTDYRFTGLKPYTVYNVTAYVRVKNQTRITPPFFYLEVATTEGIPSVPQNVSVAQINGSRIMVSWQPPKEVNGQLQGYTINYRSQSKNVGPAQNAKVGPAESSVILDTEFRSDIVYEFWVKARNGKHESISSNMVQLKFDGTSNIEKIGKIETTNITKKSVTLEWKPVNNADGYMIQPILPQSYPQLNTIWVKNSTVTLDNMVPGTQYVIRVAAYVKQYVGRHETTIVTFGGDPLPAINVRLKEQTHEYSLLEWDEPQGSYGKLVYGIYYGTNMDQLFEASKINTTATSYRLTKLRPCESYVVSVGIVGPIGPGPLGRNPLKLDTPYNSTLPPKELSVDISDSSPAEMTIQWKHSCSLESSAYPNYIIAVRELTKNSTSLVNVKSSANKTLTHAFRNIPSGASYEISVSTDIPNAQVVTTIIYSHPLPNPTRLQVWPEANGTYVVYWKPVVDFREIPFTYEAVVYDGRGVNTTIPPLVVIEAKEPPILINPDRLAGVPLDSLFTIGVRLKTNNGYYSDIVETESFAKHNFQSLVQTSSYSSAWLWIVPTLIALVLAMAVVYVVQRHRRLQTSFSRFANSHYDTRTGATRIGDSLDDDEHEHQEVPRSFSDDEPLVIA